MRTHKMTKWDAGQDLIACADFLADKQKDLKDGGYPELASVLYRCRLVIGDVFNILGSHEFGLPDSRDKRPAGPSKEKP